MCIRDRRYHGGWGVNRASCCDCKASDPLTATRALSYGPANSNRCYSDCEVCSMPAAPSLTCPAQNVDGEQVVMHSSTNEQGAVYERTGIYLITDTQKHDMLVLGGGSEEPVGQKYVCTKRYHGGWGVNRADCCDCKASDPLTATRANSYGPTNTCLLYTSPSPRDS